MRGAAQGSHVEKAGFTSQICHENCDEGCAPAGPSVIRVDTASQPHYTRTHARSGMVSARERRSL
jgi:hypothetical protein